MLFVLCTATPAAAQQPVLVVSETGPAVAGTPADAETNTEPFLARMGMRGYFFNGSTWDRMRGDTTSGLWVNVKNSTLGVTQSGGWTTTVTQGTGTNLHMVCDSGCSSSTAPADASTFTPSTTPQSPIGGFFQTTATNNALTNLQMGAWQFTAQRAGFVNLRNASGTEIGTSGTPVRVDPTGTTTQPVSLASVPSHAISNLPTTVDVNNGAVSASTPRVTIANDSTGQLKATNFPTTVDTNTGAAGASTLRTVPATGAEEAPVATATTTNGTSTCYITSAASTNSTNCKASAGNLYAIHITNTTTTNYFLRLYNSSSAPTCSSATGFVETIPALGATANGGINGRVNVVPQAFGTGLGFCLTGGGSSTDNTNAATGVYVTFEYK